MLLAYLSCALGASAYDFPDYEHDMYFNYLDDGTVEVTYYDEDYNTYSGYVTIPTVAVRGAFNQTEFDVTRVGKYAFRDCSNLTGVTIPVGIKSIGSSAFWYCTKLTTVTIPYSVTSVEYNAFGDCSNLKTVHIGDGVTSIGAYAFDSPLTAVYSYAKTPPTIANENAFKTSTYSDATLYVPGPDFRRVYAAAPYWSNFTNVACIHPYDFYYSGLYYYVYRGYYLDEKYCRVVYKDTNYNSYSSSSITVPSTAYGNGEWLTVEAISDHAFEGCTNLNTITLPSTIQTIFHYAFKNCSNLKSIVIQGCTSMGDQVFYNCSSLNSVTCYATTPPRIWSATFDNSHYSKVTLYVPASAIDAYKNADYWKKFTNIKMIPGTGLEINATNFPDANFRSYLLSRYPAGYITNEEIAELTELNVSTKSISNLTGVKYFTALQKLYCYNNPLTSLDVSGMTSLVYLDCAPTSSYTGTKLTSLDVLGCTNLETLLCYNTNISSLYVNDCTKLKVLNCSNCTKLTNLTVYDKPSLYSLKCPGCTSLATLNCYRNDLTVFEVTGNTALTKINCYENANLSTITGLETCTAMNYIDCGKCAFTDLSVISGLNNLTNLYVNDNKLTSLNVSGKSNLAYLAAFNNPSLTNLNCSNCALIYLEVTNNTALKELRCYYNANLVSVTGLSGCTALTYLDCEDCAIATLNINTMTNLEKLYCRNNKLTSLTINNKSKLTLVRAYGNTQMTTASITANSALTNISIYGCTSLTSLKCYNNALTTLDVTGNTAMTTLEAYSNSNFSSISGLAGCTALTRLDISNCNFSSLVVSALTKLNYLDCSNNQLTSLNVSSKTSLTKLFCYKNQLTSLNVQGCSAMTILSTGGNKLTSLYVQGCNSLNDVRVHGNKFTEAGMSTLINSLPTRSSSNSGKLCVVNYIDYDEQNVITANQIAAAKAKYWYPKKWSGSDWVDYSLSMPGDVTGDGVFNITDVTELTYLLLNGEVSVTDRPAADYNGDGVVNISDVTDMIYYLLNH